MLPKKHRLSKTAEVKNTAVRGRSFFNPFLVIKFTAATDQSKFTVIVSTKVSKKAVDRNRLKRIAREILREHIKQIKVGNYALIIKPKAMSLAAGDYRQEIINAFAASKYLSK